MEKKTLAMLYLLGMTATMMMDMAVADEKYEVADKSGQSCVGTAAPDFLGVRNSVFTDILQNVEKGIIDASNPNGDIYDSYTTQKSTADSSVTVHAVSTCRQSSPNADSQAVIDDCRQCLDLIVSDITDLCEGGASANLFAQKLNDNVTVDWCSITYY